MIRLRKHFDSKATARQFAELYLKISEQRWNNVERGLPISKELALTLVRKCPGVTTDWIFNGKLDGLPVHLQRALDGPENGSTTAS